MSRIFNGTCPKRNLMRSISVTQSNFNSEETVLCTEDNLEQSLHIINEVMKHDRQFLLKYV